MAPMIKKVTLAAVTRISSDELEFVLSDDTVDRYGDIIDPAGWVLNNFKKNPIALFNHNSNFPIGTWTKVRVEGKKLLGRLKLAVEGTSERIDEIIRLVQQGVLRAASVGFMPIDFEPLKDNSGLLYKEQELLETSLVSIPANPAAVQLARSLGTSDAVMEMVFGEKAGKHPTVTRGANGEQATTQHPNSSRGNTKMKTIAERIAEAQRRHVELKDQLTAHLGQLADEPDEGQLAITDELNAKIAAAQKSLESLQRAEESLASTAVSTGVVGTTERTTTSALGSRPFAIPAKKIAPADLVMRSLVGLILHKGSGGQLSPEQAIAQRYGEDGRIDDGTRIVLRALVRPEGVHYSDTIQRAASAVADTTTSGWASQLVETSIQGFMEILLPASVYPGLASRGLRLQFGRSGIISIPTRAATPTIAGSFVAEGAPIPVRQGAFSSQTLTPKKMGVISAFTRQIAQHSTPAIEGLIRNAMQEDTAVAVDSVLLDATAASAIRPAGLRNGVTVITATSGGGFAALVGDVKALIGALVTGSNGNIRNPVWIMNPIQALAIALTANAGGEFPFAAEINNGRFQGYSVILSSTVTAGRLILVDAADFVSVEGDAPRFDVSDQATLHMEDTTPLAIGTAGSPATVAAPARSLFQTDSIALRMLMDLNWAMRRAGVVAWTESVTW
jgi:HK97 family phage prohead protease/HK97 family phage major capsid protein